MAEALAQVREPTLQRDRLLAELALHAPADAEAADHEAMIAASACAGKHRRKCCLRLSANVLCPSRGQRRTRPDLLPAFTGATARPEGDLPPHRRSTSLG